MCACACVVASIVARVVASTVEEEAEEGEAEQEAEAEAEKEEGQGTLLPLPISTARVAQTEGCARDPPRARGSSQHAPLRWRSRSGGPQSEPGRRKVWG